MAEAKKAEILNIADLAAYQENAVVSSQVLRAESGNVTLFAFDKDEEISAHTSPGDAMVQVLDGEALININGKKITPLSHFLKSFPLY